MATNCTFAVAVTPIAEGTPTEGMSTRTLAGDVQRSLGGGGSVTCTFGTTNGFSGGTRSLQAITTATGITTTGSQKFCWVKHTGYSDANLTTPTAATLALFVTGTKFCELPPGGAVALPFAQAATITLTGTSSSGTIQAEYFSTN